MASLDGKPKIINETYKGGKMTEVTLEILETRIADLNRRLDMLLRFLIDNKMFSEVKEDLRYI